MAPPHDRKKRQWNANERGSHHSAQHHHHQHAQVADDLAIAATYAAQTTTSGTSHVASLAHNTGGDDETPLSTDHAAAAATEEGDDNEISLEDGCSSDASPPSRGSDTARNEPEVEQIDAAQESAGGSIMDSRQLVNDSNVAVSLNDNDVDKDDTADGDEDDDESDVDLAEAVARMDQDDDEDEGGGGGGGGEGAPPKTANEVDAYHVTVKQLEQVLGTSLSTKEWDEMHVKAKAAKLNQAGHIHYHLVEDRTIIVQSKEGVLLEEGNILVIKKASTLSASASSSSSSLEIDEGWMPLGKIFEVFGPVSRPFYSVRLPDPPERNSPPPVRKMPKEATAETADETNSSDPCRITSSSSDEAARLAEFEDPWTPNGMYTQIFRSAPKTLIYYLLDEATLINTHAVYQASGRGCDASNIHDEEVLNPKDMYYSDDDEEREATGKQRGRKQRVAAGSGHITNNPHAEQHNFIPTNYPNRSYGGGGGGGRGFVRPHHPAPQHVPGFHTNSPAMGTNVVSGFVPQPSSYPMTASTTNNNTMNLAPMFNGQGHATIGQAVSSTFTTHANARQAFAGSVPPPGQQPRPQPPAEDTVYYDYS